MYRTFFILILLPFIGLSQNEDISRIQKIGQHEFTNNNYIQARYYYRLAYQKAKKIDNSDSLLKIIIDKINVIDSIEAYNSDNDNYICLLIKSDSLLLKNMKIIALHTLNKALQLEPNIPYCYNKIDHIILNDPSIKKQLLTINMKNNYNSFLADMKMAKAMEERNEKFKAFYYYEKMQYRFPENKEIIEATDRLRKDLDKKLQKYEKTINIGILLFNEGNYIKSKDVFNKAKTINPECSKCHYYLTKIDFFIDKERDINSYNFMTLLKEADKNFNIGKYEMAHYQYYQFQKKDQNNQHVNQRIFDIEDILQKETNSEFRQKNAKLLMERADKAFITNNIQKAKELYNILLNRYTDLEHFIYIKERLLDCDLYLSK